MQQPVRLPLLAHARMMFERAGLRSPDNACNGRRSIKMNMRHTAQLSKVLEARNDDLVTVQPLRHGKIGSVMRKRELHAHRRRLNAQQAILRDAPVPKTCCYHLTFLSR